MNDFSNLLKIADELDHQCALALSALPDRVFEINAIKEKVKHYRRHAEDLQHETIKTASTEKLIEVNDLMGETLNLIRILKVPTGTLQ